jgi:hypothetical protein
MQNFCVWEIYMQHFSVEIFVQNFFDVGNLYAKFEYGNFLHKDFRCGKFIAKIWVWKF